MRFPFNYLRSKPLLGLDIHSDEICLLSYRRVKSEIKIEKTACRALPSGVIVDGKISQQSVVVETLNQLVQSTRTQHHEVIIALPAQWVINQKIKLPSLLMEDECEIEIRTHLEKYLPGMGEDLCFDFKILGKLDDDWQEVQLIAARTEQLQSYTQMVEQAGLKVKIVDVDTYALVRAAQFFLSLDFSSEIIALLDIGINTATFIIFQNKKILFHQVFSIDRDSAQFVEQIKKILQLYFSSHQEFSIKYVLAGKEEDFLQEIKMSLNKLTSEVCAINLNIYGCSRLTSFGLGLRGATHAGY